VVVLEVVAHVLLAQALAELGLRRVVVHVVVRVVVGQVADDEPGEERESVGHPEDQGEEAEEDRGEGDARGGRHHEPHRVVRVVVMDAVDHEVEAVAARELRLPVEHEAVEPVLGRGPDHDAGGDQQRRRQTREPAVDSDPRARDDHRDEDDRREGGVNSGEEVEEAALEHRRRGRKPLCPLVRHRPQ
jgi:hypothetical protein